LVRTLLWVGGHVLILIVCIVLFLAFYGMYGS